MSFEMVRLGDICEFLDHLRVPVKESERKLGPYPYYGANGQQGLIDGYIFDEPLVLLAEDGGHFGSKTRPIAYKVTGKCWVNNHAHVLRAKGMCDVDYLHRVLSFYDVIPYVTGTTRLKLTKGKAQEMLIPLPSLAEQKRIAGLLARADRVRRLRRTARAEGEGYLQSVFLEMFGDPVENPRGWERTTIGSVVAMSQYGTSKRSNSEQTGHPILGMGNITYSGRVDLTSLSCVELSREEFETLRLEPGDIIFNRTNSTELVGKTAHWDYHIDAVLASYLVKLIEKLL